MNSPFYKMLLFSGADRAPFLQGQLTQDIDQLREFSSLPAAWCSPKGRVIVTCQLFHLGDTIGMAIPASMVDVVNQRMLMYRLRAEVQIDSGEDNDLIGIFEAAGLDTADPEDTAAWQKLRVAAGRADIGSENSEQYTPHMLNLDRVGAISFKKGCYTGQEVVARTEHLGKVKRRLHRYRLSGCSGIIGDKLLDGETDAGKIVNVSTEEVLAVTPVALQNKVLHLGAGTATRLPLPYEI